MGPNAFDELVATEADRVAAMEVNDRPRALAKLDKGVRARVHWRLDGAKGGAARAAAERSVPSPPPRAWHRGAKGGATRR